MAKKLQDAEEMIQRLQGVDKSTGSSDLAPQVAENVVSASFEVPDLSTSVSIPSGFNMSSETLDTSPKTHPGHPQDLQDHSRPVAAMDSTPQSSLAADISVDEHGKICYYGPTSAVHEPVGLASPSTNSLSRGEGAKRADIRSYLVTRARESTIWEEFALGNAALQLGLSRQVMAKLLHLHWTWVAPMFMWVYRPAFMRT